MTHEQNLKIVRDACVAARPQTVESIEALAAEVHQVYCDQYLIKNGKPYWTGGDYNKLDEATKEQDRVIVRWHLSKITLSDVLLAMKYIHGEQRKIQDQYHLITGDLDDTMWNLRTDDLTKQTPECAAFLAGLLGNSV